MDYSKTEKYIPPEDIDEDIYPHGLSKEEKKKADEEMQAIRLQHWAKMTDEEKLYGPIAQFWVRMRRYVAAESFDRQHDFSWHLKEYINIINRNKKKVANELDIPFSKLKRILKKKETPSPALFFRLEKHSGNLVPASLWLKLWYKTLEHQIKTDKEIQQQEAAKVTNAFDFSKISTK